jgi:hypothetical protein
MNTLDNEILAEFDAAFSRLRPNPGSIILYYNQKYGASANQSRLEISILDREDLPVIDQTSHIWVLGTANEELFLEEDYIQHLLSPVGKTFNLSIHQQSGHRRHEFWVAELL